MALTCGAAARISTATSGGHAREAQRLELEAHLATCQRCSDQHGALLAIVHRLAESEPEPLTTGAREAVRRALATRAPIAGVSPRRNLWPRRTGAGLVLAAAAIICVLTFRGRPHHVVSGDVTIESPTSRATSAVIVLRSTSGGRVQLADMVVDMGRAAEIAWNARARRVDLRRGSVTIDVEHRAGQHLEVRTPRFTVEVLGTRFTVDEGRVKTLRGVVRVVRPDGSIAARVGAGDTWSADEDGARGPDTPPSPRGTPVAVPIETPSGEPGRRPVLSLANTGAGLAEARRALARHDALGARRIVTPLFRLSRGVAVEARVLFAESFLVEGRYADAIDAYRLVVRDFPTMDQAESSQFAIAQLESEYGRGPDARAALQAYVARYPHGRFLREATLRLGQLPPHEQR